jgi:hypothetical protein
LSQKKRTGPTISGETVGGDQVLMKMMMTSREHRWTGHVGQTDSDTRKLNSFFHPCSKSPEFTTCFWKVKLTPYHLSPPLVHVLFHSPCDVRLQTFNNPPSCIRPMGILPGKNTSHCSHPEGHIPFSQNGIGLLWF